MAQIEIEADDVEPLDIRLVGANYLINPPKAALTMGLAESFEGKNFDMKNVEQSAKVSKKVLKVLNTWILQAFGEEGAKEIHKRLNSPTDKLDFPHLMKLMTQVSEAVTGDPTS